MPNGVSMNFKGVNYWKPARRGAGLRVLADPHSRSQRSATSMTVVSGLDAASGRRAGRRRQRRPHPRHQHVADRRRIPSTPKAPTSATASRPTRSPRNAFGKDTPLPSLELAHRPQLPGRQLRERLQLRLHEHAGVELADHAAADREQPARGLRAAVRRRRHVGGSGWRRPRQNRSILDSVIERAGSGCSARSGPADRTTVGDYLDSVREVERRIQNDRDARRRRPTLPDLDRPIGIPERFDEHVEPDVRPAVALAFQADITRVVTFMLGRELNFRTYPEIGVTEGHHGLSHHGDDAGEAGEVREARHVSGRAVRAVPREAASDARRRRHAARSLAVPVRRRPEQPEPPRAHGPAAAGRRRRA